MNEYNDRPSHRQLIAASEDSQIDINDNDTSQTPLNALSRTGLMTRKNIVIEQPRDVSIISDSEYSKAAPSSKQIV